jgi:hypothetical protein
MNLAAHFAEEQDDPSLVEDSIALSLARDLDSEILKENVTVMPIETYPELEDSVAEVPLESDDELHDVILPDRVGKELDEIYSDSD